MITPGTWQKSSYSGGDANCVEVGAWQKSSHSTDQANCAEVSAWHKTSYSSGSGANCVEVAAAPLVVAVRDTKDRDGGQLTLPAPAWSAFLTTQR
ncbi:DUF397 domain-containing protein [Amycolatopsis sp. NPDC059027]|uniref:DUF397 domain-containing protein n=1 Tax=Amycolatopsis sp. NPDC059027 TaxID=3346709 RepID=UPI00366BA321